MNSTSILENNSSTMMDRLKSLLIEFSLLHKEVTLASGQKSGIYLDCRNLVLRGEAQFLIGELFYEKLLELEKTGSKFDATGGMALGSIALSTALSAAAFRRGRELPGVFVRKEAKDHGLMVKIEGARGLPGKPHILLVEDVITTASSALMAASELRTLGIISHCLAIVDREQGGTTNLRDADIIPSALFTLSTFGQQ